MGYKQLNFVQRCQIYGLWRAGYTRTAIAEAVGVHKSTISRELTRNITFVRTSLGSWQYKPQYAQTYNRTTPSKQTQANQIHPHRCQLCS